MDARALDSLAPLLERCPDVVGVLDGDGVPRVQNRSLDAQATTIEKLTDQVLPTSAELVRQKLALVHDGAPQRFEVSARGPGDTTLWYQASLTPASDGTILLVAVDVSERKRTEARLRRTEALLVDAQGTAHLGTWDWDVTEPIAVWSDELYRIYGVTPETYTPSYEAYLLKVHPDDREKVKLATEQCFREHKPYSHDERVFHSDGTIRYLHTWAEPVLDESGKLLRLVGVCQDITDRKLAELALENELLSRAEMERRLHQTQKLEAVGRFAGGIAHDFNNLMGVIVGRSSLMQRRLAPTDPLRADLEEITSTSMRAAQLTQQLLAFGRTQSVERVNVDLALVVNDVGRMLRRVVGEDVELVLLPPSAPCVVHADRGQLEQIVMNLAINARDAMPSGGTLTIEVSRIAGEQAARSSPDLEPDRDYVLLSVRDSGVGMDEAIASRIFDPYFTTKEDGRGTGLGLSTVYGIVKQSSGAIVVETKPGEGARFLVFLPHVDEPETAPVSRTARATRLEGTETVLLVEDQHSFRTMVRNVLDAHGYRVIEAADPGAALRLAAQHQGRIHLLLTDVVMPVMGGRELAEKLTRDRPQLRVLYMSGYADDAVLQRRLREQRMPLLSKPFLPDDLAAKVREVLDARAE